MSAFDTVVKRVQPQVTQDRIVNTAITSALYTANDVYIWNMQNGKIGSTNGTTYGTYSLIGIEMARRRWSNLWLGFYADAWWNQATTLSVWATTAINSVPLNATDRRCKLLSIIIPSASTFFRFSISDALAGEGGIVGVATASYDATYRIQPGLACPQIGLEFTTASAPTTGTLSIVDICRTT
jgi:hypothetical protein